MSYKDVPTVYGGSDIIRLLRKPNFKIIIFFLKIKIKENIIHMFLSWTKLKCTFPYSRIYICLHRVYISVIIVYTDYKYET